VNEAGFEDGNDLVCDGRDTAWLQDTADQDAWGMWDVAYRDVIVLDQNSTVIGVVNLSTYDLSQPSTELQLREYVDEGLALQ